MRSSLCPQAISRIHVRHKKCEMLWPFPSSSVAWVLMPFFSAIEGDGMCMAIALPEVSMAEAGH